MKQGNPFKVLESDAKQITSSTSLSSEKSKRGKSPSTDLFSFFNLFNIIPGGKNSAFYNYFFACTKKLTTVLPPSEPPKPLEPINEPTLAETIRPQRFRMLIIGNGYEEEDAIGAYASGEYKMLTTSLGGRNFYKSISIGQDKISFLINSVRPFLFPFSARGTDVGLIFLIKKKGLETNLNENPYLDYLQKENIPRLLIRINFEQSSPNLIEEGKSIAATIGAAGYFECTKEGVGLEEVFLAAARIVRQRNQHLIPDYKTSEGGSIPIFPRPGSAPRNSRVTTEHVEGFRIVYSGL